MTSAFSWENSVSLWPALFCTMKARYRRYGSRETWGWQSRRTCAHVLLWELQNYNLLLSNSQQKNVRSHQNNTPCPRAKEKPQQDGRRGKIAFGIKSNICQRRLEGSNKSCAHQDPKIPQRLTELCLSVSCRGTGQQWPATGAGALGAIDLGMA